MSIVLGPGSEQIQYECNAGLCRVKNVSFTIAYSGGAQFTFNGSTNPPDPGSGSITLKNSGGTQIADKLYGGCANGITGSNSDSYCNLSTSLLPEIDGATLPKAILLLASLFIVVRSRNFICKQPPLVQSVT